MFELILAFLRLRAMVRGFVSQKARRSTFVSSKFYIYFRLLFFDYSYSIAFCLFASQFILNRF